MRSERPVAAVTAFVLAAGFGTRLHPLTHVCPKPLVPVCGVPLLRYALAHCAAHGLHQVVVNAHHLADHLAPFAGDCEGVTVRISEETEILGTGGGLAHAAALLDQRVVVVNGDVLHDVDLGALLAVLPAGGAAMVLRDDHEQRYGPVLADASGYVVRVRDYQAEPQGELALGTHFSGVHALDHVVLDGIGPGFSDLIDAAYGGLVRARKMRALHHAGAWLDVGDPASYLRANLAMLSGSLRLALDPQRRAAYARCGGRVYGDPACVRGVELVGDVWVGEGAQLVAGARLEDSIVGERARVGEGVSLTRTVLWEGQDGRSGADQVIYPGGVLQV